jgi:hypothetical protein
MKIFCIGRNYGEHAAELKNDIPDAPVVFMKPQQLCSLRTNPFIIPILPKICIMNVKLYFAWVKMANQYHPNLLLPILKL